MSLLLGLVLKYLPYLAGAAVAIAGATWLYLHVYHSGELHERAAWVQKVEEAAAKREAERAAAQRDQNARAEAQTALEVELAMEKQEHSDALARALAANSASHAPLGVIPDAILQPFRALGTGDPPDARRHR